MVVNLANTFFIHKVVMHILGFWISPAYSIIYKIYSFFLYIFFTIPIPTLPIIFVAVDDNVNMLDAAQSLFMAIQIFGLIFKIYSIKSNFAGVEKTFCILNSEIFNQQYAGQDHILQESSRIAKRNTIVFLLFCYASLFGWGLLPIFTGSGQLPIDVWLPFKVPDTKVNHVILYIWLFMGVGYGAHSHCVLDTLCSGLIVVASGQVRVLKDTLLNLQKYTDYELKRVLNCKDLEQTRDEIMYARIKKCVQHHKAIVTFVDVIQSTYSTVMFWQFVMASLVICMCMILLTLVPFTTYQFHFMCVFMLTMLTEIYLYAYYGTELYYESITVTEAIYLGDWYNYDAKSKKALIILMERTKKPLTVMGGYVLDINIDTFTMILRRAYSLFAVLRQYKQRNS